MSLVEVLVAVTILTVVVCGAVAFMMNGRTTTEFAAKKRSASQLAVERLERARSLGYAWVANAQDSVTVDGTPYTRVLTVSTALADPADSSSYYKLVQITVDWPTSNGSPVVLRTAVSP